MRRLKISMPSVGQVYAEISDDAPLTAKAIWDALPIESTASTWGDEIYFTIPVQLELENAKEVVNPGDLGYWPPGRAFCIFFGPTPVSRGSEIRAASPVNIFGRLIDDPRIFKKSTNGDRILLERVNFKKNCRS